MEDKLFIQLTNFGLSPYEFANERKRVIQRNYKIFKKV